MFRSKKMHHRAEKDHGVEESDDDGGCDQNSELLEDCHFGEEEEHS